jgi:hypothetical protein
MGAGTQSKLQILMFCGYYFLQWLVTLQQALIG